MSEYLEKQLKAGAKLEELPGLEATAYIELAQKVLNDTPVKPVSTGSPDLDGIIGGFENGRLYVLSAPTKQGKTTLAQTVMYNMAKQGDGSIFFSYEMGWKEVTKKWMDMDQVGRTGKPTNLPMYIPIELDRKGGELQYQWLYEAMLKAKEEQNIKLAVIDHLHFLLPLKDFQNTSFIIGGIVREIKRMAVRLDIPIILICHVQKIKDDKVPDWTDIRDSSFITQEADCVLMMFRTKNKNAAKKVTDDGTEDVYRQKAILSVELDRAGGRTGKIGLWHNGVMFEPYTAAHKKWEEEQGFIELAQKVINKEY